MSELVNRALNLCIVAHEGQYRKASGLPYSFHPIEVANQLSKYGFNNEIMIAAALLHDVLEDTSLSPIDIEIKLGQKGYDVEVYNVVSIVKELTYDEKKHQTKQDYLESFENKSLPALIIKCVDRLCNSTDYASVPETLDYAIKYFEKASIIFSALKERLAAMKHLNIAHEEIKGIENLLEGAKDFLVQNLKKESNKNE